MTPDLTGMGSIPAKQKRTKEIENCLLAVMKYRNALDKFTDEIEVDPDLTREWRDFLVDEFQAIDGNLESKYQDFRDRFTDE